MYGSKSTYQDSFKKKSDPFAHKPTMEERKKSEDARVYLEEATSDHAIFFSENVVDSNKLEAIFAGNASKCYHLLVIGLFIRNRRLLKSSRK